MPWLEEKPLTAAASSKDSQIEELQRRVAALTLAVEARDTFIAVAAHELRNPMTPIIGQIDLMLSMIQSGRCPPEQVEQRLLRLQYVVRHYMRRAGILLDVSRINGGKLCLEVESSDLAMLLRDTAGAYADAARRAGIPITVTASDQIMGAWDRLAVEQIVDNLLSNAMKYGCGKPIEVSAGAHGDQVYIQVRDYGGGVPARERERIFSCFERAVGRGERRSGFGVGLWVVGQLAEAMGGSVMVEDAPGGGALFTVTLPRHAAASS